MKRERIYLSTIAADAPEVARQYGFGLEIADYCTAYNMDDNLRQTASAVRTAVAGISRRTLHAPFSELFPCAVDPRIRQVAADRYHQALALAAGYGAERVVIHGGYNEHLYFPCWYRDESVKFWSSFADTVPDGMVICLENVLEDRPEMIPEILAAVTRENLAMCLDIGHAQAYSRVPAMEWLERCGPYLRHFHIHNNDGTRDSHNAPEDGVIPVAALLRRAETLCLDATFTLEVLEARPAAQWLEREGLLED